MKLVRILHENTDHWGILNDREVLLLTSPPFPEIIPSSTRIPFDESCLLPPSSASKVVMAGLNYLDHAHELQMDVPDEPILFLKPPSSVLGHNGIIIYPENKGRIDFEAELALIINRETKNVAPEKAYEHILGYTCLNDVTARELQKKDGQWTRAKSFDTFCPAGPWIETDLDTSNLTIQTFVNGIEKQHSSTSQFIFSIQYLVSFISGIMTLLPGDIISTGTPPGVGELHPGDSVEIKIEGIGTLHNTVRTRKS